MRRSLRTVYAGSLALLGAVAAPASPRVDSAPQPQGVAAGTQRTGLGFVSIDRAKRKAVEAALGSAGLAGRGRGVPSGPSERSCRFFVVEESATAGPLRLVFVLTPAPVNAKDAVAALSSELTTAGAGTLLDALVPDGPRDLMTLDLVRDFTSRWAPQAETPSSPATDPEAKGPGLFFESDAGIVIIPVKPEKTAVFEAVIDKLDEALTTTQDATRRRQAAGWRIYRATHPGPDGSARFVFWLEPPVPQADYSLSKLLFDAFGAAGRDHYDRMREALVPGGARFALQRILR